MISQEFLARDILALWQIHAFGIRYSFVGDVCNQKPQITGSKKQSEERAPLFSVRVNLSCYLILEIQPDQ
jgi:hypothetical protein